MKKPTLTSPENFKNEFKNIGNIITKETFKNQLNVYFQNSQIPQIASNIYEDLDAEILEAARTPMVITKDLMEMGLTKDLGGIGVQLSGYQRMSAFGRPTVTMSPSEGKKERSEFEKNYVPVPMIVSSFDLNIRELETTARSGQSLDLLHVAEASKSVSQESELMVWEGSTVKAGDFTIPGLTTVTNRETKSLSNWLNSNTQTIIADVRDMVTKLRVRNFRGPYMLYVSDYFYGAISDPRSATSDTTFKDMLLRMFTNVVLDIKPCPYINPADPNSGNAILVQMDKNTIDMAIGSEIDMIPFQTGPFSYTFTVFSSMIHRIKIDENLNPGVCVGSYID